MIEIKDPSYWKFLGQDIGLTRSGDKSWRKVSMNLGRDHQHINHLRGNTLICPPELDTWKKVLD